MQAALPRDGARSHRRRVGSAAGADQENRRCSSEPSVHAPVLARSSLFNALTTCGRSRSAAHPVGLLGRTRARAALRAMDGGSDGTGARGQAPRLPTHSVAQRPLLLAVGGDVPISGGYRRSSLTRAASRERDHRCAAPAGAARRDAFVAPRPAVACCTARTCAPDDLGRRCTDIRAGQAFERAGRPCSGVRSRWQQAALKHRFWAPLDLHVETDVLERAIYGPLTAAPSASYTPARDLPMAPDARCGGVGKGAA